MFSLYFFLDNSLSSFNKGKSFELERQKRVAESIINICGDRKAVVEQITVPTNYIAITCGVEYWWLTIEGINSYCDTSIQGQLKEFVFGKKKCI